MEITFQTVLTPSATTITLDHEVEKISVTEEKLPLPENSFYLFFAQKECQAIGKTIEPKKWDKVILIQLSWEIEAPHMIASLLEKAQASGLTIMTDETLDRKIPTNIQKKLATPNEEILTIFSLFGYSLGEQQKTEKKKPAKARHRWSKKISEIPFTVNFRNSQATLYWLSRNEMLIKSGATLLTEAPRNKDGSVGYSAKYGEKLRDDFKECISNGKTTKDIIVKSVNEASLLLYFGGTNSWLEIVDENGKSIDEWTKVE
ncbi:MAG: hypothetical protein ACLR3E_04425 [Enterococcus durans]